MDLYEEPVDGSEEEAGSSCAREKSVPTLELEVLGPVLAEMRDFITQLYSVLRETQSWDVFDVLGDLAGDQKDRLGVDRVQKIAAHHAIGCSGFQAGSGLTGPKITSFDYPDPAFGRGGFVTRALGASTSERVRALAERAAELHF